MLFHVERIMQDISIHALREESDPRSYALYGWQ